MIAVRVNEDNFIYDIHSLAKAFYPAQDVKVFVKGEKNLNSDAGLPELSIDFKDKAIAIEYEYIPLGADSIDRTPGDCDGRVYSNIVANQVIKEGLDYDNRASYKNELKLLLYKVLSNITGRELPWGTLTGIRPTKIAKGLIDAGSSDAGVLDYMKDTYLCSDEKASLSIDIAHYENKILEPIDYEKGYSVYIGIPFCPSTCLYCSFTSFPIAKYRQVVQDYIDAVKKEIDYVAEAFAGNVLNSVYIGGGTPTTLEAKQLRELISYVKARFDWSTVLEFTVEAGRADSITREKLETLLELGVTRISVNPQTMNEETLRIIGRKATAEATVEVYKLAREVGFDNINMDLIVGLPNETIVDVRDTLNKVRELNPDSLTVHSLAIKRASRLAQVIDEMGYETISNSDDIMTLTGEVARDMEMKPYYLYRQKNMSGNFENVGYAKAGKAGIYNILIMEELQSIVAIGAGTVSKRVFEGRRIERCDNVKDVALYISKIEEMIDRKRQLFSD